MHQTTKRILSTAVVTMVSALGTFSHTEQASAKTAKPPTENKAGASSGWRIKYFPGQITAGSTVYLSNNAIKIVTDGSFEVVAKAPTWSAIVSNTKKKISCELPSESWIKQGFFLDPPNPKEYMNPRNAASSEKINYRGLPSKKQVWHTIESDNFIYRARSKPQSCSIELISTDAIPVSPMQRKILSTWYGIPNLEGLPLFWQNVMKSESSLRLKVAKVEPAVVAPTMFEPLKGTKRELSMLKLVDNKFSTALTDFMEMDTALDAAKNSGSNGRTNK